MKSTTILFVLTLFLFKSVSTQAQFNINSSQNYFEQCRALTAKFDSIRQARQAVGDSSMQGTGLSGYLQLKAFWDQYMPQSGNFTEAVGIYQQHQYQLKKDHFATLVNNANNNQSLNVPAVPWDELGPYQLSKIKSNVSGSWVIAHDGTTNEYSGNHVGKIDRLFQHPVNANVIYALAGGVDAGGGGLFKSTDYGNNWVNLGTDKLPAPSISSFGVKPLNSEPNTQQEYLFIGFSTGAVYRSSDNGANWLECTYNGTNNYPYAPSSTPPFSLPYDFTFLNVSGSAKEHNPDMQFAKNSDASSNFARLVVIRDDGMYYSDNPSATITVQASGQITNQIQWNKITDNPSCNLNQLLTAIPYTEVSGVSRMYEYSNFESSQINGNTHYFLYLQACELNAAGDKVGVIKQYILTSTDFGVTWSFLGGLTGPVNANGLKVLVPSAEGRYFFYNGNIEIKKNNPTYIYVASTHDDPVPSGATRIFTTAYSLYRYKIATGVWENLSKYSGFANNGMITQPNGFAVDPTDDENWWYYTNSVDIKKNGVLTAHSTNYATDFHPDVRDVLLINNGQFQEILAATDGGVYRKAVGTTDYIMGISSEGINTAQSSSVGLAQQPPFYVSSGFWHAGLQIFNPTANEWHYASLSDGIAGDVFFLNKERFLKGNQNSNFRVIKNYNSLQNYIPLGVGASFASSENMYGRAYFMKSTSPSSDKLLYTNDDFDNNTATTLTYPYYSTAVRVIPNEPDKLFIQYYGADNQFHLNFMSGFNSTTPTPVVDQVVDMNSVYNPTNIDNEKAFMYSGIVEFDARRNGKYWIVSRQIPIWSAYHEQRILEYDPVSQEFIDLSFPTDDDIFNSSTFPNWLTINDLKQDRQTGILYIGTTNGVYYLDRDESVWKKYSTNVPMFNARINIRHCTGEIFVSSSYRGIWSADLIRTAQTPTQEWIITGNQTWEDRINLFCTLIIEPGATLTVKDELVVFGNQKIIVKPGGKLIVENGKITSECGDYWQGIEVWGNSNLSQTTANQGYLRTINSTIENAREAVSVWRPDDWGSMGGIVIATTTTFKNNRRSVCYMPYHTYTANGNEIMNKGRFTDCNFIWDNNFNITATLSPAMTLFHVNGVIISGSTFEEQRTVFNSPRHSGIYCLDAKTTIQGRKLVNNAPLHHYFDVANYDVSEFKNLTTGIEAGNSSTQSVVLIDHCRFTDDYYGVVLKQVDNAVVTRNSFTQINLFSVSKPLIQLTLEKSTGFKVEGNLFNSNNPLAKVVGTYINNGGVQSNETYRNKYTNLMFASYGAYQNQNGLAANPTTKGLVFKCNENTNPNGTDEQSYLTNQTDPTQGIRLKQGLSTQAAKNTFTIVPNGNPNQVRHLWSLDNDNMIYYYNNGNAPIYYSSSVGTSPITDQNATCPSTFTDIGIGTGTHLSDVQKSAQITLFNNANANYNSKLTTYNNLVNAGNSSTLFNQVRTMSSDNKQAVRDAIDAQSPFVSEALLRAVGEKPTDLVPVAWFRDLVLNNIEVAHSDNFISWLETKRDPLPAGYVQQIRDVRFTKITAFSIKTDELISLSEERSIAATVLTQNALADSTEAKWSEYRSWVTSRNDILYKAQLADAYLGTLDYVQCNNRLIELESQLASEPASTIKQEMIDYISFKRYLLTITGNSGIVRTLSEVNIEDLTRMRDSYTGISAVQAGNVLCFHAGICADVNVPNDMRNAVAPSEEESPNQENLTTSSDLLVVPNPNDGVFELSMKDNCIIQSIEVIDALGKKVETISNRLENMHMQLKLSNAKAGIYVIVVECADGRTLQSRLVVN